MGFKFEISGFRFQMSGSGWINKPAIGARTPVLVRHSTTRNLKPEPET
jgi:hypothetical protein